MLDLLDISRANADLDGADAGEVVAWAAEAFCVDSIVCTSSFGDASLVHLVATHAPGVEIVLLDTQFLFPETWALVGELQRRFDFPLRIVGPTGVTPDDELWRTNADACCNVRKVEPLARALEGRAAWITGIRRAEAATRASAPVVGWDPGKAITKINPKVTWSDADLDAYNALHDLPEHALVSQGFASIGCWPCTRAVAPGEDRRAGRWAGQEKTECGLHL